LDWEEELAGTERAGQKKRKTGTRVEIWEKRRRGVQRRSKGEGRAQREKSGENLPWDVGIGLWRTDTDETESKNLWEGR